MGNLERTKSMYNKTFDTHWPANINGLTPEMFAAHLFNRTHNPLGVFNNRSTINPDRMREIISLIKVLRDYSEDVGGNWYRSISRINRTDQYQECSNCLCPAWRSPVPLANTAFDQIKMALINGIPKGVKGPYINALLRWEKCGLMYSVGEEQEAYRTLAFFKIENGPMPAYPAFVVDKPGPV